MSVDLGINFRSTSTYVTDGTNETYCLGDTYPVTRGGATFGYSAGHEGVGRDRNSGNDRRLAGTNFWPNNGTQGQFRLDLPNGAGTYTVHLALGDASYAQGYQYLKITDGNGGSTLLTIDDTNGTSANNFDDAGGTNYTAANWPGSEAGVSLTFSGSVLWLLLGSPTAQANQSTLAHLRVVQAGGGGGRLARACSLEGLGGAGQKAFNPSLAGV